MKKEKEKKIREENLKISRCIINIFKELKNKKSTNK